MPDPAEHAPTDQTPTEQASTEQAPTGQAPTGPAPTGQTPTGRAPTGPAPTGQTRTEQTPTGPAPTEQALTRQVLDRLAATPDPRLREVMHALVRHLHAFAAEVRLTEREWMTGIEFLTAVGRITDATRQEFILLSDTLGLSSLVDLISHGHGGQVTESTVLGPFYRPGAPWRANGESIAAAGQPGDPLAVRGQVRSAAGHPLPGAVLDVWQAAPNGLYDVQDPRQPPFNLRGRFRAGEQGRYAFATVRPGDYPVPHDGPVGQLLQATGRHPWRAAHIHLIVTAPGHAGVTTHIFDAASRYLDSDTVFGVKDSLVRQFARAPGGAPGYTLAQDFVLRPAPGPSAPGPSAPRPSAPGPSASGPG
jgi:protocatechuate 3,4-dioxygenase beta subunit